MGKQLFSNNAETTLSGAILDSATSLTLTDNTINNIVMNDDFELITLENLAGTTSEIVKITNNGIEDITGSTYSGNSFYTGGQTTTLKGVFFNSDGTRFFILSGSSPNELLEYTCSVGFDLSSKVDYSGNSYDYSAQSTSGTGLSFNSDGTKFYIISSIDDTIYEYTCSVGFDLSSTVTYSTNSFSVAAQLPNASGIIFNNDGTKFFVIGHTNDTIYEYTCSIGFDLGSVVAYSTNSFSVAAQDLTPLDVIFNNDGLKMFIVGSSKGSIYEYTLSVAFDLSSVVTYTGDYLYTSSEGFPAGFIYLNSDGSKLFITENNGTFLVEYNLTIPYSLSNTVTDSTNSFLISAQETAVSGLVFNTDGTKFFIVGYASDSIHEYTCSVGFDLGSTVAYSGNSILLSAQEASITGLSFNSDGTKFFIIGTSTDTIYEYTCSIGFDLGSVVAYSTNSFSLSTQEINPTGLYFNTNGTKFFIVGYASDSIHEYTCSIGFDLGSTVAYSGNSFSVAAQDTSPRGLTFNSDGTKFYISGTTNDSIYEYTCSGGFDLNSTVVYSGNSFHQDIASVDPRGLSFNSDGSKLFIADNTTDSIYEYDCSTLFTLEANPKYVGNTFDINGLEVALHSLCFSAKGTKLYAIGGKALVYEFDVETPFDISSTVSYTNNSFYTGDQALFTRALRFSKDGTSFYTLDVADDIIYQYTCSIGFDLGSTVAYSGNSFSVAAQDTEVRDFIFNSDGTKFFVVGNSTDSIYEYDCSVGFDLSSIVTYSGNTLPVTAQDTIPDSIAFSYNGKLLYVFGEANKFVYEYTLSVGFDLGSTVAYSGISKAIPESSRSLLYIPTKHIMLTIATSLDLIKEYTFPAAYVSPITVERGQENTLASAFSSGDKVEARLTAGSLNSIIEAIELLK